MKVKPFVFPVLYVFLILLLVIGLYFTSNSTLKEVNDSLEKSDITYVSSIIFDDVVPVVNVEATIGNPYTQEGVTIARYFYNIKDDIDRQKES